MAEEEVQAMPVDGGDEGSVPAVADKSEGKTALTSQLNQVDNDSPVSDPKTDVPDNLVALEEMTKDKLLNAVKDRYDADGIYTYVADILVAMNPYKWIDMYGRNYKERYNPTSMLCSVPHVYGVAQAAAKNLRMLDKNQVCLISGESGAGKTETAKLFMHHLLTFSDKSGGDVTEGLERKILESQPLLEAFGNAKTGLNDNSSRFGKYIEVLFEDMDTVVGARVRKYLLEKARVVHQGPGERNFHAFYYLADSQAGRDLGLLTSDQYRYLQNGEKGDDSEARFLELDGSLRALGFEEELIASLWTVLAAILKIGQLEFANVEGSTDDSCKFKDDSVASDLADTLDVTMEQLYNAITTKHIVTAGETFHKPLNAEFSGITADTMAQNLYDNLFSWLVEQLNAKMSPESEFEYTSVAVLDIFGFENFKRNGFEQLFINTANERLQNYFIVHIFTNEIKELREEGVRTPKIEYTDNVDQVAVLLGDPGIFLTMDEQTKVPNATDHTMILKMHSELSKNPSYDTVKNSTVQFQISHYAGAVKYEVEGFLEKNRNSPSLGIAGLIKSSKNPMIASLFKSSESTEERAKKAVEMKEAFKQGGAAAGKFMRRASQMFRYGKPKAPVKKEDDKPKKKLAPWQIKNMQGANKQLLDVPERKKKIVRVSSQKKRAKLTTLGAMFKGSLEDLMEMLESAQPHFVRCIKPNMTKQPDKFDAPMVQKQLNYTGVLETTKIRQLGYPLRVSFRDFVDRYRDVSIPATQRVPDEACANYCIRILQKCDLHGWAKGKTKMLLQYEHVRALVDVLEGKKKAADEERAKARAIQAQKDAEAAEIKKKRDAEVAKIRAAAEAQPSKIDNGLSWQEEMELAKKKKKAAAEAKKKKEAEEAAAAAAAKPKEEIPEGERMVDCADFVPHMFKKGVCNNCYAEKRLHKGVE